MLREPLRVALVSGPAGASLSQHPPPSLPLFPPPHPPLLPPSSSILSLVNFTIARRTPAHVATVTPIGRSQQLRTCESHLQLAVLGLSSRLTWHDFAYVTMAQKVPSSIPLSTRGTPNALFQKDLATTCPSPPTPRRYPVKGGWNLRAVQAWHDAGLVSVPQNLSARESTR